MRLHHQIVEDPAPRRALTPGQALRLAREGPAGARLDRGEPRPDVVEIVLPEVALPEIETQPPG